MIKTLLLFTVENYSESFTAVSGGMHRINSFLDYFTSCGIEVKICQEENKNKGNRTVTVNDTEYELAFFTLKNLSRFLRKNSPDLIFCEQWYYLPYFKELLCPLVLDVHGSLVCENYYRNSTLQNKNIISKIRALRNCDALVVPNQRQKDYYLSWLLLAGFNPENIKISVLPVSFSEKPFKKKKKDSTAFIYSGNGWPWIDSTLEINELARLIKNDRKKKLKLYMNFPLKETENYYREKLELFENSSLEGFIPHDALRNEFEGADVALDLYRENFERYLACSTRTIEYLSYGLPVITYEYLDIAKEIREFDAGWVLKERFDLKTVLEEIDQKTETLVRKRTNALSLLKEKYSFERNFAGFVDFLEGLRKISKSSHFIDFLENERLELERDYKLEFEKLEARLRDDLKFQIKEKEFQLQEKDDHFLELKVKSEKEIAEIKVNAAKEVENLRVYINDLEKTHEKELKNEGKLLKERELLHQKEIWINLEKQDKFLKKIAELEAKLQDHVDETVKLEEKNILLVNNLREKNNSREDVILRQNRYIAELRQEIYDLSNRCERSENELTRRNSEIESINRSGQSDSQETELLKKKLQNSREKEVQLELLLKSGEERIAALENIIKENSQD